ncbi:MAG: invasion associated locus B family protein [Pseudomonadota bacterium]
MIRPLVLCLLASATPLSAKDSLGVFSQWAAFRDAETPRCYAIAQATNEREPRGYASVGTWPARQVRGQLHLRLSRSVKSGVRVRLSVGDQRFDLTAQGRDAWASDKAMDAAIIAAMRSASGMSVSARAANGIRFVDRYSLDGAATAMDAAVVGCSEL